MIEIVYIDLIAGIFIGMSIIVVGTRSLRESLIIRSPAKRKLGHINLLVSLMLLSFALLPVMLYDRPFNVYLMYFAVYMFFIWRISQSN